MHRPYWLGVTLMAMSLVLSSSESSRAQHVNDDHISDPKRFQDECPFPVERFVVELQQEDVGRRWRAAECLGGLKDPQAVAPLVQAILNERFPRLTLIETEALRQIGDPSAEDLLLIAMRSERTRDKAIYALGRLQSKRAVEPILEILKHGDGFTVGAGMDALADIKDKRALGPLCALLKNPDEVIRRGAALDLGFLEDGEAVNSLISALKDSDDGVRENAASSLGRLKATIAVDALIGSLSDPDEGVRVNSLDALGTIGDARVVNALATTLTSATERTRWHAASALSLFDTPEASDSLTNALHHGDLKVVAAGYKYFLRKNDSDSVAALIRSMHEYGSYEMADALLHSGKTELVEAARDWESRNELQLNPLE